MKSRPDLQAVPSMSLSSASDAPVVVQIKVWLVGISPMVWRRVLVPAACTLRELHGVFQIAMGWQGIHLYQFSLRATRYGSAALAAPPIGGRIEGAAGGPDLFREGAPRSFRLPGHAGQGGGICRRP